MEKWLCTCYNGSKRGYCLNIETVVNNGILDLKKVDYYDEDDVRILLRKKQYEPMAASDEKLFREELIKKKNQVQGKDFM